MGQKYIILLVDDDSEDREILIDAIGRVDLDILCHIAKDGLEALMLFENDDFELPDIIFLDLNMPRMDGKQFLRQRTKIEKLASIPVFIYTTTKRKEDDDETQQLGAKGFITKPVFFEEIVKTVAGVLETQRGVLQS